MITMITDIMKRFFCFKITRITRITKIRKTSNLAPGRASYGSSSATARKESRFPNQNSQLMKLQESFGKLQLEKVWARKSFGLTKLGDGGDFLVDGGKLIGDCDNLLGGGGDLLGDAGNLDAAWLSTGFTGVGARVDLSPLQQQVGW